MTGDPQLKFNTDIDLILLTAAYSLTRLSDYNAYNLATLSKRSLVARIGRTKQARVSYTLKLPETKRVNKVLYTRRNNTLSEQFLLVFECRDEVSGQFCSN